MRSGEAVANESLPKSSPTTSPPEIVELRESIRNTSAAVTLLTKLINQTTPIDHGPGVWGRMFILIAVGFLGWISTSLYIAKSTEAEIRISNAILTEQVRETREKLDEYKKETSMKTALADERYRQISIAMESRGIKMPTQ